jgi:hypothetical protein
VVLIDDARLFLAPPPLPSSADQWPSLSDVIERLRALSQTHEMMVVNDVIAFYPNESRAAMVKYAREHGVDWLVMMHQARRYDDLVRQGSTLRSEQELVQRPLEALRKEREAVEMFPNDEDSRLLAENVSAKVLVRALARRLLRRARLVTERIGVFWGQRRLSSVLDRLKRPSERRQVTDARAQFQHRAIRKRKLE